MTFFFKLSDTCRLHQHLVERIQSDSKWEFWKHTLCNHKCILHLVLNPQFGVSLSFTSNITHFSKVEVWISSGVILGLESMAGR
jgi:hypothetical protein